MKTPTKFLLSDEGKIIHEIKNSEAYKLIHLEGKLVLKNIDQVKSFLSDNPKLP